MPAARRVGRETSETRARLLDIVEQIMVEDGYAAVSSRRIAKDAGVTPALVHYYFGTLDDLFIAALRRRGDEQRERQERVLSSPQPLRALWSFLNDQSGTGLLMEFMALANHRKAIRSELARYADEFRSIQLDALEGHLETLGLDAHELSPSMVLVTMAALSRTLVMEDSLGMEVGMRETRDAIEALLRRSRARWPANPSPRRGPRRGCPGSPCSGTGCPRAPSRISSSVGFGWSRRNAVTDTTKPGVQKPHCRPWWSRNAACTGESSRRATPMPSIVVTSAPSACTANTRHDRTASPSTARCRHRTRRARSRGACR